MTHSPRKTALFLCRCGPNMADTLDLDALGAWAEQRGDLALIETHNLLCSPDGKELFQQSLVGKDIEAVVVAACSPKMHEATFQELAEAAGLNMSRVQMANVREHCAWVTKDPQEALEKAKRLVNAAVRRCWQAKDLVRKSMEVCTDLLILGGGVAGIEAALTAARAGRKVTLVEREIALGGSVIKTEEVAPNMDCAPCLLAPRLAAVDEEPNIEVIANAEVLEVVGFWGNFTARILKKARYVDESCIGCEACFEVCPVELPSRFHLGMGNCKAVHGLFPGAVPAAAVIEREHCKQLLDGSCDACVSACPFDSIDFTQQDEQIERQVGAVVVATGFAHAEVAPFAELGYGRLPNVLTLAELERMASSNGPTGGKIRRSDGQTPASVAVIHCAGSRRPDGIPYCSGICCVNALKVGTLLRHQSPEAEVYSVHHDLVLPGPKEHAFCEKVSRDGTRLLRTDDPTSVRIESATDGKLCVQAAGIEPLQVEMVVLATGLAPPTDAADIAALLHIERRDDGFFAADHDLLHATGSTLDGVYLAGCAAGPCNVGTSVTRARAAAGDAISKLVPGRRVDLEVMTSSIDEELCAGCKLCVASCPYKAVVYDGQREVCRVNEAICRGCGTCTATCPSGASSARHFTDEQIYAEIGGLFHD